MKVFRVYERLSRDVGEAPFSYVYFLNNLSYMQSLGIVLLAETKVNRAYAYTVSLIFNTQVLDAVNGLRFG